MTQTFEEWIKTWKPIIPEPKEEKVIAPLKVGDIYLAQWGYEANISQFYKIIKITEKFVTMQECEAVFVQSAGFYDGRIYTCEGKPKENKDPFRVKIHKTQDGFYFKLENYKYAYKWNGGNVTDFNWH